MRSSILRLVVLTTLSLFALPSRAQPADTTVVKPEAGEAAESAGGIVSTTRKRAILPKPEDDRRTRAVLNNLAREAGWFPDISIDVKQGMVTIRGTTKDADRLRWLAETADRIPSVIAVINQATVETPPVSDFAPAVKEMKRLIERAKKALPLVGLAAVLALFFAFAGKYFARGISSVWGRHIQNPFLLSTVTRMTMLPLWIFAFYLVLQVAGLSSMASTIIGGTGAIGIVLGFAFKDIAENYISGLILSVRSPFTKGDEIVIDKYEGYVQALSMRGTTILDYDGSLVLIPNRIVLQSVIRNISVNPKTRISFYLNVALESSVERVQEAIHAALKDIPAVLAEPKPMVIVTEVTKTSIVIRVLLWYNTRESKLATTSAAINASVAALRAAGITLLTDRQIADFPPVRRASAPAPAPDASLDDGGNGSEQDALKVSAGAGSLHRRSETRPLEARP